MYTRKKPPSLLEVVSGILNEQGRSLSWLAGKLTAEPAYKLELWLTGKKTSLATNLIEISKVLDIPPVYISEAYTKYLKYYVRCVH